MQDIFNETNKGQASPSMLMDGIDSGPDLSKYRYRVERFSIGDSETGDEDSALEALLTRSIDNSKDVIIIERKDSISPATGVYTIIVIYLEKRPVERMNNA